MSIISVRIGVFGGCFNPPHIGHLIGAEFVREEFKLDKVIFIPCYDPPHRDSPCVSPKTRFYMTKLAIKDNPYFEVLDIEIARGGKSYTIDTIKELMKLYPDSEIFLIIGCDQAEKFDTWHRYRELLELCRCIILRRKPCNETHVRKIFGKNIPIISLDINVSSNEIRERVRTHRSIKYLVPEAVQEFIQREKLYLD